MSPQELIESGILEQYALGFTSPEETAEVERMLVESSEVRVAFEKIASELESFVIRQGVEPPAYLKSKILKELNIGKKPPQTGFSKIMGWIGALALAGFCLFFWRSNENLTKQLEATKIRLEQLQKDCETERLRQQNLQAQIDQYRDPTNRIVTMKGLPIAPEAFATVLWNATQKQAHLDIGNLPAPPAGKQYQLWAIVAGKPVDMGVFDIVEERDTLKTIALEQAPQAFAVTLEQTGGSPSPTLEMMYVVGNVQ